MEYLGIDVHTKASVWCLLDENGEVRARGRVETTVPALGELVTELLRQGDLRVGQEVGTMAYLVSVLTTPPRVRPTHWGESESSLRRLRPHVPMVKTAYTRQSGDPGGGGGPGFD